MRDKKLNEHGTCKILEREWLGKRGHIHTVSWLHRMWFMMTSYLISGIKNKFHFLSSSTWLYYHLLLLLKLPPIYLFLPFLSILHFVFDMEELLLLISPTIVVGQLTCTLIAFISSLSSYFFLLFTSSSIQCSTEDSCWVVLSSSSPQATEKTQTHSKATECACVRVQLDCTHSASCRGTCETAKTNSESRRKVYNYNYSYLCFHWKGLSLVLKKNCLGEVQCRYWSACNGHCMCIVDKN